VSDGDTLSKIANNLEVKKVVKSATMLKIFTKILSLDTQIDRGDYLFDKDIPLHRVAWMLARGHHNIDRLKITFKEGITNEEIAVILSEKLVNFRRDLFFADRRVKEGYLFPDTYLLFPLTTTEEVINDMTINFNKRITLLEKDIISSGYSKSDIIIMASILEKEAKGKNDIGIISGILWKRISIGMPLQVDAAMVTYKIKGLPSEPISNPGMQSINASINPIDSSYLFYLHDKDGNVHYAKTFNEHRSNINKYLR